MWSEEHLHGKRNRSQARIGEINIVCSWISDVKPSKLEFMDWTLNPNILQMFYFLISGKLKISKVQKSNKYKSTGNRIVQQRPIKKS